MSETTTLQAADGHRFPAYIARPAGAARGGIVVLQEIFGLNAHIRAVADGYAAAGYFVVAPSTFSRIGQGEVQLGYTEADMKEGFGYKSAVDALPAPGVLADIQAAVDHAAQAGKVGIVGYCWGGLLTWRSAALVQGLSAAAPYYGGGMTTPEESARQPRVPVLAHFGEQDHWIPLDTVQAFQQAHPEITVHVYPAHHGFNCDHRGSYDQASADLARERTLAFFRQHVG